MIRSSKLVVAALVVFGGVTHVASAQAQPSEPELAPEVPALYAERVGMADIPLVAGQLNLDDGQTEILRQLFLDYLMAMDVHRQRYVGQILEEQLPTPQDDPDYRLRQEHRKQFKQVRASQRGQAAAEAVRQELKAMSDRDVTRSRRLGLIRSWQSLQAEAYVELLESMEAILAGTHPEHWPAIERALLRRNSPWRPLFTPERVNLSSLVYMYFGQDSAAADNAYETLVDYDVEFDLALQRRDQVMAHTEPLRLDARDYRHPERMISTEQAQIDARVAMWRVNDAYIGRIANAIGGEDGVAFKKLALDTMYPDIYPSDLFENAVEYAMQYEDLSESQLQEIVALRDAFFTVAKPLQDRLALAFRSSEPERYMRGVEDNAMLRCYQVMDSGIGDMEPIYEMKRLTEQMNTLDKQHRVELRRIIGSDTYDAWPGFATRAATGDLARGPVPDADPNAPVVYLDSMHSSATQSSGD